MKFFEALSKINPTKVSGNEFTYNRPARRAGLLGLFPSVMN
jgi:hypothetical protein